MTFFHERLYNLLNCLHFCFNGHGIEKQQLEDLQNKQFQFNNRATFDNKDLIYMMIMNNHAVFTENNSVDVITDGRDTFSAVAV